MRFRRAYCILITLAVVVLMAGSSPSFGASADTSVESAEAMIAAGDFGGALVSLENMGSEDAETIFLRAVVLAELNRDAEAESMFRDLIESYPDYPEPYNNLAVLLAENGRFDEAVDTLKGALRTHPSYRTAWDNLTTIYGRLASEAYSRALNVDSSAQEVPVKLALLGTLSRVEESRMNPVEAMPAVAVAEVIEPPSVEVSAPAETLTEVSEASMSGDDSGSMRVEEPIEEPVTEPVDVPVEEPAEEPVEEQVVVEEPVEVEAAPAEASTALEPIAQGPEETVPADAETEQAEPEQFEPEVSEAAPSGADLTALVEAWAAAWSEQRPDDYLSFYSETFTPQDGSELAEWKTTRRSRLEAPEFIKVSIALLDYEVDGEEAKVVFNQSYESNTFSDLVTKTLSLSREEGLWRIVRETVSP